MEGGMSGSPAPRVIQHRFLPLFSVRDRETFRLAKLVASRSFLVHLASLLLDLFDVDVVLANGIILHGPKAFQKLLLLGPGLWRWPRL